MMWRLTLIFNRFKKRLRPRWRGRGKGRWSHQMAFAEGQASSGGPPTRSHSDDRDDHQEHLANAQTLGA
jgi:hypothetical protein